MRASIFISLFTAILISASPIDVRDAAPGQTGWISGNVANDVVNGVCAPLTVIFARGTKEEGNIGTDVGPYLFQAIIDQYGKNVALQGVDYNATWPANTHLGHEGAPQMASLIKQAQRQCPSTKITLGGFSQGAMVLHKALRHHSVKKGDVQAAVAFGDPYRGLVPETISKALLKEFCGHGDNLCRHHGFTEDVHTHVTYGINNATEAAKFLIDNMNSGGGFTSSL